MNLNNKKIFTLPDVVELELTTNCNFNCIFCPRKLLQSSDLITDRLFNYAIKRIIESNIRNVKLCGMGEPTLYPGMLKIIKKIKAAGLNAILNTNASLLHLYNIDELLSLLDGIIISIHSLKKKTYKFITQTDLYDISLNNINTVIKKNKIYKKDIYFYVVLTNINKNDLKYFKRYKKKVNMIISGCTNRALGDFSKDIINRGINNKYNRYSYITADNLICQYAMNYIVIDKNGNYLICSNDINRKYVVGNIMKDSIINTQKKILRDFLNKKNYLLCKQCDNYKLIKNY